MAGCVGTICTAACQTAVTAPPRVGCAVWSLGTQYVTLLKSGMHIMYYYYYFLLDIYSSCNSEQPRYILIGLHFITFLHLERLYLPFSTSIVVLKSVVITTSLTCYLKILSTSGYFTFTKSTTSHWCNPSLDVTNHEYNGANLH